MRTSRAVMWAFTWLMSGCCMPAGSCGSDPTAASTQSETSGAQPAAVGQSGQAEFNALAAHLREGHHHGEGPAAIEMASAVREILEPRDGVAVKVFERGTIRTIVVLVRFDDDATEGLADLSEGRRQEYLEDVLSVLDDFGAADARVGVGIRGGFLYGAVATRQPGAPPQYAIGRMVDTANLAALLAPVESPTN